MRRDRRSVCLRTVCIALPLAALTAAAMCASAAGCTSTSTAVVYTPITGIVVRSSELLAGHGCGTNPDQVYAYAAVLAPAETPQVPYTSTVTPCYADAVLSNLQSEAGTFDYVLYIYAYNYQSFPPELACTPPRLHQNCPGDYPEASTAPDASDVEPLYAPNWETTCRAVEQQGIPVLADCLPLEPAAGPADGGGPG
jgi:hypothetical protein